MEIIEAKHLEDCFDGSYIKELLLSCEISKEFIFMLGKNGELQYLGHFAKPFFKIRIVDIYDLKGVEGNRTMRIHLKHPQKYSIEMFNEYIKNL